MKNTKLIVLVLVVISAFLGPLLFSEIMPGGDVNTNLIWGSIIVLAAVVSMSTSLILEKLDELKNK
ncbi:hypothetical protein [Natranaerobius thermophilus]|uniref:Uncharacterized protein n=1 Tax=Natranaerobius thermophilus (strain ATCC BAA-1301 / DSM 18059 / JW/NM-WN-LF) TaxID=457570 RepID=B2A4U0_NATTJ|nr:hypothetical protein [Natranaerobius thermophilus]ACB83862.1 hypothetical protein Nther_0264 [Natranaerobius thermophilus JW/NM-WN-LF]